MYRKLPLVRIKQKGSKEKVETFLPVLARQLVEKDALSCASFGLCSENPLEAKAAVTSAPATKMDCVLRPRFVRGQCVCVDALRGSLKNGSPSVFAGLRSIPSRDQ